MGVIVTGTTTYIARTDSGTANNPNLNPNPGIISISFTNDDPDVLGMDNSGDLELNFSAPGTFDPNTSIVYNGVSYPFTLELDGTMLSTYNNGRNVDPSYLSQQVVIVEFTDNTGFEHRVFFFPNAPQSATNIQAISGGALSITPGAAVDCLCEGTQVLTANGLRAIETIRLGDFVLNESGVAKQVIWIGSSTVSAKALRSNENLRPIRIPAGALGALGLQSDLFVSPQHRIAIEGVAPSLFVR